MSEQEPITVKQAAERVEVSEQRIRQLCISPRKPILCRKFGRAWMIDPDSLDIWYSKPENRIPGPKSQIG